MIGRGAFRRLFAGLCAAFLTIPALGASSLRIEDAMARAREGRPEVKQAQEGLRKALLDEPGVLANTDPAFVASGMRNVDESPQTVPQIFGTRTILDDLRAGFRKRTLIGTELELMLEANRQETEGSLFMPPEPVVTSALGITMSQALLKNLWGRPDRARRAMAHSGVRAAEARLERARAAVALDAAVSFLEHFAAREEMALRERAVTDAEAFFRTAGEKGRFGLSEESDLAQASVNLELRRLELTAAGSRLVQTRIRLLESMGDSPLDAEDIVPEWDHVADLPGFMEVPVVEALDSRPDLRAQAAVVEGAKARVKFQKLLSLPSLSVQGSYSYAGLSNSYSKSLDDTLGLAHPVYGFGLTLNLPLRGAVERIARENADADFALAREEQERLLNVARREILSAGENLSLAGKRAATAETLADLQRRKFRAEEDNFEQGRSSTETLLRFAEEERAAQRELLSARVDLAKALYSYRLAVGQSLER